MFGKKQADGIELSAQLVDKPYNVIFKVKSE